MLAKKLKRAFACPLHMKLELIPTRLGKPESRTARWTRIGVEDHEPTLHRNALATRAAIDAVDDDGPEHNATAEQSDEEKGRNVEVVQLCEQCRQAAGAGGHDNYQLAAPDIDPVPALEFLRNLRALPRSARVLARKIHPLERCESVARQSAVEAFRPSFREGILEDLTAIRAGKTVDLLDAQADRGYVEEKSKVQQPVGWVQNGHEYEQGRNNAEAERKAHPVPEPKSAPFLIKVVHHPMCSNDRTERWAGEAKPQPANSTAHVRG